MSWGYGFGSAAWGGAPTAFAGGFFITGAIASGSTTFRVAFSEEPSFTSPLVPGDASNLALWRLCRLDTLEEIVLLSVASTSSPLVLEFTIFGRWAGVNIAYQIEAIGDIVDTGGNAMIAPKFANFSGMPASSTDEELTRRLIDLRNPQAEPNVQNGALVVQSNGDYQLEGGNVLLKKLVIRRILTAQGAFYHLADTDYGLGVQSKDRFTAQRLVVLRAEIERQTQREPEIDSVRSAVQITPDGVLIIQISAVTITGTQLGFNIPLSGLGSVVL